MSSISENANTFVDDLRRTISIYQRFAETVQGSHLTEDFESVPNLVEAFDAAIDALDDLTVEMALFAREAADNGR